MTRRRLTLDTARQLLFEDLSKMAYALVEPYEADEDESPDQIEVRISRTLDEAPDVYAWLLQLHAYFDHWATGFAAMYGMKSTEYLEARCKRDLMENAAKAAKLRYEATSRRLTQITRFEDESKTPRSRG